MFLLGLDIPKAIRVNGKPLKKVCDTIRQIRADHPGKRIEIWFQDEARFGQQGTLTLQWALRGSRPVGWRQT